MLLKGNISEELQQEIDIDVGALDLLQLIDRLLRANREDDSLISFRIKAM